MTQQPVDQRALLAAIRANPDEDVPRLMYADWLDENGDPDRAEFIRVQCALARMPPKPRELFVVDGEGKMLDGMGVAMTPRGGGHYSVSIAERGLSVERFEPNERVDVYSHFARGNRAGWMRGLKYVKEVPGRNELVFRKDGESGPWVGAALAARESVLAKAHPEWLPECPESMCGGRGYHECDTAVGRCPVCVGTGRVGALVRGFPLVRADLIEFGTEVEQRKKCDDCEGRKIVPRNLFNPGSIPPSHIRCRWCKGEGSVATGRRVWHLTPWAIKAVREYGAHLEVVDREPYQYRPPEFSLDHVLNGLFRWGRRSSWGEDNTDLIPDTLFDLLPVTGLGGVSRSCRYFDSREGAIAALNDSVNRLTIAAAFGTEKAA